MGQRCLGRSGCPNFAPTPGFDGNIVEAFSRRAARNGGHARGVCVHAQTRLMHVLCRMHNPLSHAQRTVACTTQNWLG
eukprot:363141-Chlamydomonas_euryale.AAC.6